MNTQQRERDTAILETNRKEWKCREINGRSSSLAERRHIQRDGTNECCYRPCCIRDITFHDSLALLMLAESLIHDATHDVIHRNKNKQIVQTQKGLGNTITANQSQSTFELIIKTIFYLCVCVQRWRRQALKCETELELKRGQQVAMGGGGDFKILHFLLWLLVEKKFNVNDLLAHVPSKVAALLVGDLLTNAICHFHIIFIFSFICCLSGFLFFTAYIYDLFDSFWLFVWGLVSFPFLCSFLQVQFSYIQYVLCLW